MAKTLQTLEREVYELRKLVQCLVGNTNTQTPFLEISPTYAMISDSTAKRMILVLADEFNNGDMSLYLYADQETGNKFLQTIA